MIDSAVSLSQKELLDSMLAELPEYRKTPSGGAFSYPSSILVETNAKVVPFDSTLIAKMEPVIKEPTPYIDGFPTTPPLRLRNEPRIFFEAGVGYPTVPFGTIEGKLVSSPATSITAGGGFHNNMGTVNAIKNTWDVGANAKHIFMLDSLAVDARQPQLDFNINYASRDRSVRMDTTTPRVTQNYLTSSLGFELGEIQALYLDAGLSFSSYADNLSKKASESSFEIFVNEVQNFFKDTSARIELNAKAGFYSSGAGSDSVTNDMDLFYLNNYYHSLSNSPFEWKAGFTIIFTRYQTLQQDPKYALPYIEIKKQFSNNLLLGFSYDPKVFYNGLAHQSKINPFYSPGIYNIPKNGAYTSLTVDNMNFALFAEQYLSADDYLRCTARYITRYDDIVFRLDSALRFYTEVAATRHFVVELGGNVKLFTSDKLATTVTFASTVSMDDEKQLPFVPQLSIQSSYTFASLSKVLMPKVEFTYLGRTERSIALINAEANYALSERVSLKLRLENILGSANDFWSGYNEYPRAIKVSIRAAF